MIESFASLPAGWHFGEGVAAERSTIDCAAKIAVIAATNGWEMEAFPGIAGDVTIACYRDEFELEIIVTASGGYAFASSVDDIRVERDLDAGLAELLDRIAFFGSCNTYGSYIHVTEVAGNPSFQELPSEIFHRLEFPSSSQFAPQEADTGRSAVTSETITTHRHPRFSFGFLKKKVSPLLTPFTSIQPIKATLAITTSTDFPTPRLKSVSRTIFDQTDGQTIASVLTVKR